ncbi:MAG: AMP-binding protein [Archaeoglobales archaeon]|nr:AMP-binding protein [Archaeoglobales archaeon]
MSINAFSAQKVELEEFWINEAKSLIWKKKFDRVLEGDLCSAKWFLGGRINVYENLIKKHSKTENWNKTAIISENEIGEVRKISYAELNQLADRIASGLKDNGLQAGDWLLIYAPPCIESFATILAGVKLCSPFEVVFTGFGWLEVAKRISLRKPRIVFTVDGFYRNKKIVEPLKTLRKVLDFLKFKPKVIVHNRLGSKLYNELAFEELLGKGSGRSAIFDSQDPLFGLHVGYEEEFKPVTHSAGGFLVQAISTAKMLGISSSDTIFCTIWPCWITGATYGIFAPLMLGSTILSYEGAPDYPNWNRYLELIEKHKATVFITAGGILRILSERDFSRDLCLKAVFSTPDMLNAEVLSKIQRIFGEAQLRVMFIQGELGSFVTNSNAQTPSGSVGKAMPGFLLDVVNGAFSIRNKIGRLIVRAPWPAMPLDREFRALLKNGFYDTMNLGLINDDGYIFSFGRRDSVLRIKGYRLSPGAIESAIEFDDTKKAVVVGIKDEDGDELPIVIVEGAISDEDIKRKISERFGAFIKPYTVVSVERIQGDKNEIRRTLKNALREKRDLSKVYEILKHQIG